MQSTRYTRTAAFLHWLLFVALIAQIVFGLSLDDIPKGTPERAIYFNLHKSTGLVIGLFILARLYWRLTHAAPPFPQVMPAWERVSARWGHVLLYVCMLVMPLSGYIASNFTRYGVNFFNSVKLPPWGSDDKAVYALFNDMHIVTGTIFMIVIGLHILAAVRHMVARDGVVARMWPWGRGSQ